MKIIVTAVAKQYLKNMYIIANPTNQVIPSQLANTLGVNPSNVSKMTRKLAKHGWIEYEHYGKMYLTIKGKQLGQTLVKNNEVLEQFLKMIGVEDAYIVKELDEIEFHISPFLIKKLEILNQYFSQDELRLLSFYQFRNNTIPPLL